MTKKNRGSKGKRDEKSVSSEEKEVVIFIGLVEWSESNECLKKTWKTHGVESEEKRPTSRFAAESCREVESIIQ